MRQTLITLLLAALALPLAAEKKLTPEELKEALERKEGIYLLDVRNPEELVETGVIEGYVNIPLDQLEKRLSEVPKNKVIVTMCMRGHLALPRVRLGHDGTQLSGRELRHIHRIRF